MNTFIQQEDHFIYQKWQFKYIYIVAKYLYFK